MSLFEIFIAVLLLTVMTATGALVFDQAVKPARLSMAAAEISATMRYYGLAALVQGQTVTIRFSADRYFISAGAAESQSAGLLTRKLPSGVKIDEARFGTGSSAGPVLKFFPGGISSPGHVVLNSTVSGGSKRICTITRSLRGQTRNSCEPAN